MNAAPISNDHLIRLQQLEYQRSQRGFLIHATVFALTIAGLFVINLLTGGPWWVQWPLIGWGLGLAGHVYLVSRMQPRPGTQTPESTPVTPGPAPTPGAKSTDV